ncbi:MAG: glutathione synthase [Gammaproteobacteria bacterium]
MALKLGIVMDPIEHINITKDSSFAMMLAAQQRAWELHYMNPRQLYSQDGCTRAMTRILRVQDNRANWFSVINEQDIALSELDAVLMRKDPPFDIEYITTTWLLDSVEQNGTLVVNKPASLRDANEKLFTTCFPQCCVPMLVSSEPARIRQFVVQHGDVILKPLDSMGGHSIFRVQPDSQNLSVILELMTRGGDKTIMAQRFIPEISAGDKRILLIDGDPVPYALARVPAAGETRGNLVAGATGVGVALTERDHWICAQVSPVLRDMGILFAGLDVIGDYLTEINITSPTCIRELDQQYDLDIAGQLMECIESRLNLQ